MSTATAGRAREWRVRDHLEEAGYPCIMRAAGSKGAGDLLHGHYLYGAHLIQVGTGNKTLGPDARKRLCHKATLIHAVPLLATVVHQRGYRTTITYWRVTTDPPSRWQEWTP